MKQSSDTYLKLCTQYYEFVRSYPNPEAYTLYLSYAKEAKGPSLEAMCGTGSFLIPLLEAGIDMHGLDASQHMLDRLLVKAQDKNLRPTVWCEYIETFKSQQKYPFIFISPHSFGLMVDPQCVYKSIKALFELLTDDGVLVFDAFTYLFEDIKLNDQWRGHRLPLDNGDMLIASFCDTPFKEHVGSTICRYELVHNNRIVETEIEEMAMRFHDPDELVKRLHDVGFTSVKMMGEYDRNTAPHADAQCVVYECRK